VSTGSCDPLWEDDFVLHDQLIAAYEAAGATNGTIDVILDDGSLVVEAYTGSGSAHLHVHASGHSRISVDDYVAALEAVGTVGGMGSAMLVRPSGAPTLQIHCVEDFRFGEA
jgi:hypothetical protein